MQTTSSVSNPTALYMNCSLFMPPCHSSREPASAAGDITKPMSFSSDYRCACPLQLLCLLCMLPLVLMMTFLLLLLLLLLLTVLVFLLLLMLILLLLFFL